MHVEKLRNPQFKDALQYPCNNFSCMCAMFETMLMSKGYSYPVGEYCKDTREGGGLSYGREVVIKDCTL